MNKSESIHFYINYKVVFEKMEVFGMKILHKFLIFSILFLMVMQLSVLPAFSQKYASDPPFKVKIDFNRWHDVHELWDDMRRLEKAFPEFLKLGSVGKSYNGQEIMYMTINNPQIPEDDLNR